MLRLSRLWDAQGNGYRKRDRICYGCATLDKVVVTSTCCISDQGLKKALNMRQDSYSLVCGRYYDDFTDHPGCRLRAVWIVTEE